MTRKERIFKNKNTNWSKDNLKFNWNY